MGNLNLSISINSYINMKCPKYTKEIKVVRKNKKIWPNYILSTRNFFKYNGIGSFVKSPKMEKDIPYRYESKESSKELKDGSTLKKRKKYYINIQREKTHNYLNAVKTSDQIPYLSWQKHLEN